MNKIYCFCNDGYSGWWTVVALAEDGEILTKYICSHENYFKHDIGITSDWQHNKYKQKYPNGYELIWVDEPEDDDDLMRIISEANKGVEEL